MPDDELTEAFELGSTCALAAECGRDLRQCAQMYGELFPAGAFDTELYTTLSLTGAFSAPWATAQRLRVANRAALWVLAVGRMVDRTSTGRRTVAALAEECLAVADGASPHAAVTRFLADLRDELATVREFEALRPLWRDQLARMLEGMTRAWSWRDTRAVPSFARYLDNADSRGTCFVDVSHWIYAGDFWARRHLAELREVSAHVQRYLHLLADIATYRRAVSWGDLNVLMLGVSRAEVGETMARLAREVGDLLAPVGEGSPRTAAYLRRQIGFNAGYHGISGYWQEM